MSPGFQSFFYWKSASKILTRQTGAQQSRSFNPSSIGNRPQSDWNPYTRLFRIGFQSFFYWKSASKNNGGFTGRPNRKFQSFFYWKSASKNRKNAGIRQALEFQSFFYWKSASKTPCASVYSTVTPFQSFFYWKSASKQIPLILHKITKPEFQSFFYWKSASKFAPVWFFRIGKMVSILLLLEIGLKVGYTSLIRRKLLQVSILLLLEIGLKGVDSAGDFAFFASFNPSSIGNRPQRRHQ